MISVICIIKNSIFKFVEIKGHSDYDKVGKDIVCSAVSAITNGTFNFINEKYQGCYETNLQKNKIIFNFIKFDKYCNLSIELMVYQLENISLSYSNYLKISKKKC